MYEGIIRAMKKYSNATGIMLTDGDTGRDKTFDSKVWHTIVKGNKHVQYVLSWSEITPTAIGKWNKKFDELNWKNIFKICFKVTPDVQLGWFQVRLLHRVLPTNIFICSKNC